MKLKSLLRIATFALLNISVVITAFGPAMNPSFAHDADPMFQPAEQIATYHTADAEQFGQAVHID